MVQAHVRVARASIVVQAVRARLKGAYAPRVTLAMPAGSAMRAIYRRATTAFWHRNPYLTSPWWMLTARLRPSIRQSDLRTSAVGSALGTSSIVREATVVASLATWIRC